MSTVGLLELLFDVLELVGTIVSRMGVVGVLITLVAVIAVVALVATVLAR